VKRVSFSLFFKINFLLTTLLYLFFLSFNTYEGGVSLLLSVMGTLSSAWLLYGLYFLLLLPFGSFSWVRFWLGSSLFIFTNMTLVMDLLIYRLFHFHINAMVLNILTSWDAMDSIQLGRTPFLLMGVLLMGFVLGEWYLIRALATVEIDRQEQLNRRLNRSLLLPLVGVCMVEKVAYGIADLLDRQEIVGKFQVIPLYQPLTFSHFASKYLGFDVEKEVHYTFQTDALVNYPLEPLEIKEGVVPFDIFIFAMDSVKYSILDKQVAPNLMRFKEESYSLEHHYSGGNATRFGIFSLFYGLNATYWFSFLNAHQPPVLFDALKRLGYKIDIFSSTNTNWPEFRKTCYVGIPSSIHDHFEGKPWQKDQQSTQAFIQQMKHYDVHQPIFSFLFWDAPHGYSYPESFNRYGATSSEMNYLNIAPQSRGLVETKKRYQNAIAYDDMLFGKILTSLKEAKRYDNALIIFTSDHGQEFYEYGNFGHNSAFSEGQIHVPLFIKLPKSLMQEGIRPNTNGVMSAHQDLVPSLLGLLGVMSPAQSYSNGQNLFRADFQRKYTFVANWNNNAIVTNDYTYLFSNLPNKMFHNEVRNANYEPVESIQAPTQLILDVMNENKKFLK